MLLTACVSEKSVKVGRRDLLYSHQAYTRQNPQQEP